MVLSGDFYQLPPVQGTPIYRLALQLSPQQSNDNTSLDNPNLDWNIAGARLFILFRRFQLNINHRSINDPELTRICNNFRHGDTTGLVEYLQQHLLTIQDAQTFRNAAIISPGNLKRHHANVRLLTNFARQKIDRVISWRVPCIFPGANGNVADIIANMSTDESANTVFRINPELMQHFVASVPIYNKHNTKPLRGLANGTKGNLYALEWRTPEIRREALAFLAANLGDVTLPVGLEPCDVLERPILNNEQTNSWPADLTLVPNDIIIPIKKISKNIVISSGLRSIHVRVERFEYELAFVRTVHIMQGQSKPMVIMSLLDRPGRPSRADFQSVYTALTRVERGENLRIIGRRDDLGFMADLRPPNDLVRFDNSYDAEGNWQFNRTQSIFPTSSIRHRGGHADGNRGIRGVHGRGRGRGRGDSRGGGRVGNLRGSITSRQRVEFSDRHNAGSRSRSDDSSGDENARLSAIDRGRGAAMADMVEEFRLARVPSFSSFYVPILRDIFCSETITTERIIVRILEHYWNHEMPNLHDSIIQIRTAYQTLPFFTEIGTLLQPHYYIDAIIQENLMFDFKRLSSNALIRNFSNFIQSNSTNNNVLSIREFVYQLIISIRHFQNSYIVLGRRVYD